MKIDRENKHIQTIKIFILFIAISHVSILLIFAIIKLDISYLNVFAILELNLFFPNIIHGALSQIFAFFISVIIYFVIYLITNKRK